MNWGYLFILIFVGLIVWAVSVREGYVEEMRIACEEKGGYLLDHTEIVGKSQSHDYACVEKSLVIPYKP